MRAGGLDDVQCSSALQRVCDSTYECVATVSDALVDDGEWGFGGPSVAVVLASVLVASQVVVMVVSTTGGVEDLISVDGHPGSGLLQMPCCTAPSFGEIVKRTQCPSLLSPSAHCLVHTASGGPIATDAVIDAALVLVAAAPVLAVLPDLSVVTLI